jgi:hypothetical protein
MTQNIQSSSWHCNRVRQYFHGLSLTIYALLAEARYILSVLNTAADSANGVWHYNCQDIWNLFKMQFLYLLADYSVGHIIVTVLTDEGNWLLLFQQPGVAVCSSIVFAAQIQHSGPSAAIVLMHGVPGLDNFILNQFSVIWLDCRHHFHGATKKEFHSCLHFCLQICVKYS